MTAQSISQDRLKELLNYDPETGVFTNRVNRGRAQKGMEAGNINNCGYRIIMVDKKKHQAHRLAWLYVHGEFPPDIMDHINHVIDDNRISNLRLASHTENSCNRRISSHNKSGVHGVYWNNKTKVWTAQIKADGRRISLGSFKSFDLACRVRKEAENQYGFHENHGDGSNTAIPAPMKPKTPEMLKRLESY